MMLDSLSQKNCIITGGSRGLGAQIASELSIMGANILLTGRNEDALKLIASRLSNSGHQKIYTYAADFFEENSADEVHKYAKSVFEKIDILINNAAVQGPIGPIWKNDPRLWEQALFVNLISPVRLSRLCAEWMIPNKCGKIISISGGGATGSRPNFSSYAVAKTGLVRFSEILAEELKEYNIQVNSVAPGIMPTSLLAEVVTAGLELAGKREFDMANKAHSKSETSLHRAAQLVAFLASNLGDNITGKLISAVWDPWEKFNEHILEIIGTDIYTLRRIVPKDRGFEWGDR